VAKTIVLTGEPIALGGEHCIPGTLGVALGPGFQQQGAQCRDIVGKRLGSWVHARIRP
jgi:hypothetical protein